MASEFEGPRTAIVTGGAKRIGAEIGRALAADGWHVLIHCHRSGAEAEALAAELGNASVVAADLADPGAAEAIVAALDGLPPPRLLVNNASRFVFDSAADFDVASWDAHLDVNLRAPALLSRAFAARVGAGPGLIVNLLDAKIAAPNPDFFSYTVSKLGLAGLTELCARAFAPAIRVCGIAPSVTLVSGPQSRDNFEAVHDLNALGRGVEVAEIVAALRFIIATPSYTGQTILLDGGQRFLSLPRDVQFLEPELMQNVATLDGLVPDRLRPKTRKIVLEDYRLELDIGFHEFEIGNPQRLLVTIEVWVDERSFAASDEAGSAWDYDFLRTEIGALVAGRRFNLQETVVREIYDLVAARRGVTALRVSTRKPDIYPDCAGVGVELASFYSSPMRGGDQLVEGPSTSTARARSCRDRSGCGRSAQPLDHQSVIGPDRPRLVARGLGEARARQRRRQRAGEPVPEQAVSARRLPPPRRPSRRAPPTSAAARPAGAAH